MNDGLGHSAGDDLLVQVARRLENCVRASDTVARFGGDEFVILLEELTCIHDATRIPQRILDQLAQPFELNGYEAHIGGSIGIALSTLQYQEPDEILRNADAAMYQAKSQGKGQYVIFDPSMQASAMERLNLENKLRKAIERQDFALYYQPIVDVSTGDVGSFEMLIRWFTPEGSILPTQFVPIAEETGLITPLGWWAFEQACYQLRHWQHLYPRKQALKLNINFSAIQLKQTDFVENVQAILDKTQLIESSLIFEITESCLLEKSRNQVQILHHLKELGIQICIDDFGTGYSSLSRLHEFPIDALKIDRTFIKRMQEGAGGLEMVKMIIALARSLAMNVIAEGVETEAQLRQLRHLNCQFAQGHHIASPVDRSTTEEFIKQTYSNLPLNICQASYYVSDSDELICSNQ